MPTEHEFAADLIAVLDATDTDRAVIVSRRSGAQRALPAAVEPERVAGLPSAPAVRSALSRPTFRSDEPLQTDGGWQVQLPFLAPRLRRS
jgi:pimeloyl-ACP methyl ester carboxylesterase